MKEASEDDRKAAKAIFRILQSKDGQVMLSFLKDNVGFEKPLFNIQGTNVNEALLKDGGRQLIVLIEKLNRFGARLNPDIDTEE